MARSVKVNLEADVAKFKEPMRSAKESVDALHDKVEQLDHSLDKIPADAAKAAAAMKLLKGDVGEAEMHFKELGDSSAGMTILQQRIKDTRTEVKKLTDEFVKTGDVDVFHKLGKAQGELTELNNLRKKLSTAVEGGVKDGVERGGPQAANTFSSFFQGGLIKAFQALPPELKVVAVALAAVLAIPIGAAIGGAVLAAVGVGAAGLAGYAAVLADSQGRIAAAGGALVDKLTKQLAASGKSAIGPLLDGIHEVSRSLDDMPLDRIIQNASKFIEPLANGAARFATYLSQGVSDLVDAAGPTIKVLADELPALGRSIKSFFDSIAGGSEGGARALQDFLRSIESFITETGRIIGYLEKAYGAIRKFGDGFEDLLQKAHDSNILLAGLVYPAQQLLDIFDTGKESAEQYGVRLDKLAHDTTALADASKEAADQVKFVDTAFSSLGKSAAGELTSKILDNMFALDNATIRWQESLAKLDDTAKKNGTSLDVLNEKTGKYNDKALANEKVLLAAAQANADLYAQNLLSGDSAEVAGAKYQKNSEELRKQAIAAGYNAKEIDGLIGKYGDVPQKVQTILATIGLTEALNHLGQILVDFRSLDDKTFQTKYFVDTYYRNYGGRVGGEEAAHHALPPGHRAGGGPVKAGAAYIVGEEGPEYFVPSQSGAILPADMTRQMAHGTGGPAAAASWAGGGTTTVVYELRVTGNGELRTLLQGMVRKQQLQLVAR